jgi:hypothetical protein
VSKIKKNILVAQNTRTKKTDQLYGPPYISQLIIFWPNKILRRRNSNQGSRSAVGIFKVLHELYGSNHVDGSAVSNFK